MKVLICAVTVLTVSTTHAGPGVCGDPAAGDCCADNGTPGCDDTECCQAVCAVDAFCCDIQWDSICVLVACDLCDATCECGRELCTNPLECPPGAIFETELCGFDVNGGCGSVPQVFIDANCGDTFCGTGWADAGTRDTDWYLVEHAGGTLTATLKSMFNGLCFIVDGIATCMPVVVGDIGCSEDSVALQVASASLPPGEYAVFVAAGDCAGRGIFDGFPCDSGCNEYAVEIDCLCPCAGDDDCPPDQICENCECVPANDLCHNATPLVVPSGGSLDVAGTTTAATFDGVPFCGTSNTAPGVWYSVTGNGHTMTASTCGEADFNTKISVLCPDCPTESSSNCCVPNVSPGCDDPGCEALICGMDPFCCDVSWDGLCAGAAEDLCDACLPGFGMTCVAGQDDTPGCSGFTTDVSWCAGNLTEYLILVHGLGDDTGDFTLTVSDDGSTCAPAVGCLCDCAGDADCPPGFVCQDCNCMPPPCFEVIDQQLVCHPDGTTFTFTVEGIDACTGGTSTYSVTASGGAAGEELCFTLLINGDQGGFCCSTEVCVVVPDCSPDCDLNGDGIVDIADFLALLATWDPCSDCGSCPADFDGDCSVGINDLLILLANWG